MQIDLQACDEEPGALAERLRADICIVGGGLAGLLLAERLSERFTVTLLEAGGSEPEAQMETDPFGAMLAGVPHAGTRIGRVRAFGGCSLTWGGQLLALPEDAAWAVPAAVLRAQVTPWGSGDTDAEWLRAHRLRVPAMLAQMPGLTPRLAYFLPFSRRSLAKVPGRKLLASRRVKVVCHGWATELVPNEANDRITGVEMVTPAGKRLRVAAKQYVIAAGTVESCRLLLASRGASPAGLGNEQGQVGKNFHDHLTVAAAEFTGRARERVLTELRPWVLPRRGQGRVVYSLKLEPSPTMRAELGLPRGMAHVTIEEPASSGVGLLRGVLRARQERAGLGAGAVLAALPRVVAEAVRLVWEARWRRRRYVSEGAIVRLQLNVAQEAPSASQVRLSQETDARGVPKAVVDWEVSGAELLGLRRFAGSMKQALAAAGLVEGVRWEPSLFEEGPESDARLLAQMDDARHAMGGACLGEDPRSSVVDPELRVHGVANLWVASAAVFPDGAAQLPTLTLTALCMRLAARLEREMQR